MKNKVLNLIFAIGVILTFSSTVNATMYPIDEIPDNAFIIGTHMFVDEWDDRDTNFYDGYVSVRTIMIGSTSIKFDELESDEEMIVYNKIMSGWWTDAITGDDIEVPTEDFYITHINGVCNDPSCNPESKYKVTFSNEGASDVLDEDVDVYVNYGEKVKADSLPELGSRPGYKFACWTLEDSEECFDFSTPITSSIVLETSWELVNYSLSFNDNIGNGKEINSLSCVYGESSKTCTFYNPGEDYNPGFNFKGWSLEKSGGKIYPLNSDISALLGVNPNITLYAIWEADAYTIAYDLDGGTFTGAVMPVTKYDVNSMEVLLNSPKKDGYTFVEWEINLPDDASVNGNTLTITNLVNLTLTAKWTPIKYQLEHIDQIVGDCTYDQVCTLDDPEEIPSGEKFLYWKIISDNVQLGSTVKNLTSSNGSKIYVTPVFENLTYTITYDYKEGIVSKNNVTTFDKSVSTLDLNEPTRKGYTFARWTSSDTNVATVNNNVVTIKGYKDFKLTASWNAKSYTIIYGGENVSGIQNKQCTYDQECKLTTTVPTREGYEFAGWELDGYLYEAGEIVNLDKNGNVNLTAKWTNEKAKSIVYHLNDGTWDGATPDSSFFKGEHVTLPTPSKKGYTFDGWFANENLDGGKVTSFIGDNNDKVYYAKWEALTYLVHNDAFDIIGDVSPVTCTYDQECQLIDYTEAFADRRYNLLGWSFNKYSNKVDIGPSDITVTNLNSGIGSYYQYSTESSGYQLGHIYLFPVTTVFDDEYTIGYYLDGGEIPSGVTPDKTYGAGENVTLFTPTKNEYEFAGWEVIADVAGANVENNVLKDGKSNVVLVAKWTPERTYYVYFDGNGGNGRMNGIECKFGVDCEITANTFTRDGYTFDKWYYTANGSDTNDAYIDEVFNYTENNFDLLGVDSIVLRAQWKSNTYTVQYDGNTYGTCNYGEPCNLNNLPDTEESKFLYWELNSNRLGSTVLNLTAVNNGVVEVTPVFENIEYNISYNYNNGTVSTQNITLFTKDNINNDITLVVPQRVGYSFAGYEVLSGNATISDLNKLTISAVGDISLIANYVAKEYAIQYHDGTDFTSITTNCTYDVVCNLDDTVPIRDGYTFVGWKYNNLIYKIGQEINLDVTGDVIFNAEWIEKEAKTYEITYNLNGGIFAAEPTRLFVEGSTVTLAEPSRNGYTFDGWCEEVSCTSGVRTISDRHENVVLYAKWTAENFNVTYHVSTVLETNDVVDTRTYDEEFVVKDLTDMFQNEGYKLIGWSLTENGSLYYGLGVTINWVENLDLYPVYEQTDYYKINLIYDFDPEIDPIQIECKFDENCKLPDNKVIRDYYEYDGWISDGVTYSDEDVINISYDDAVADNKFIYDLVAVYVPIEYEITYLGVFDESGLPTSYNIENAIIELPLDITSEGGAEVSVWEYNGTILTACESNSGYVCYDASLNPVALQFTVHYLDELITVDYEMDYEPRFGDPVNETGSRDVPYGQTLSYVSDWPTSITYSGFGGDREANVVAWQLDSSDVNMSTYVVKEPITLVARFS